MVLVAPPDDRGSGIRTGEDHLAIPKVFLIGKEFGGRPAYLFALLHPERVSRVVTLGVPYTPPRSRSQYDKSLHEGFYINGWQEPGRAEDDFGRLDAKTIVVFRGKIQKFHSSNLSINIVSTTHIYQFPHC